MFKWFEKSYSRILIDNHITEDDPSFMTKFNPAYYVSMVKKAKVDSAMVYACCHNGNCYYPTKVGHMHKNLDGRDIFGETVGLLRKEGIKPLAYYTVVFHNDSAKTHPQWRARDAAGGESHGRYWFSCANSLPYRQFAREQLAEITGYDIDGIFIDMTFWQNVCLCYNCRERYLKESGCEIPQIIDWNNPKWVLFQRSRQRWIAEFAEELSFSVKAIKPDITVVHQFAPVLKGWLPGQSPKIAQVSDYTSGDFYGGKDQQRFATKIMASFSKNIPYEFHTSRCVTLWDHTSMKSEAEMVCSAATTLANGGAYLFIDAINPDGTLFDKVYQQLGRVAARVQAFKEKVKELRPILVADTGLYFSMSSNVNEKLGKISLMQVLDAPWNMDVSNRVRTIDEVLGASIVLNRAKIPYRVITSETIDFGGLKTIIINNAAFMSEAEIERIREFVRGGGTLIVTGMTSYYDLAGHTSGDFALEDCLGVSYIGSNAKRANYLALEQDPKFVSCDYPAPLVKATSAKVLGGVAQTIFAPDDVERYASIHSNPPGPVSEYAGLTVNTFGKGRCIYLYSSLLAMKQDAQQSFGESLFKEYASSDLVISTNAPRCVEITILKSTIKDTMLICFVNYQQELPNVPVCDLKTEIKLPDGKIPKSCRRVSDNKGLGCKVDNGIVTIELAKLETVEMIEVQ